MRKKIVDSLTIFFISALYLLAYSTEGYVPTIEPGKEAITASQPCHAKENGNNIALSLNAGTKLTLRPDFRGVYVSRCLLLEKIAYLMKYSSITKCVNESSTAALCRSNTLIIYLQTFPNGTSTILVTGPKELIVKLSPFCVTADFSGTTTDLKCYFNGSTSAGTEPTNSTLTSSLKADLDDDTPTHTNSTVAPIASLKPEPDVGTTTNSTVTPSLKPHTDAGTATNYSTVTPSLKPHPNAGKLEVGPIVGMVVGILVVLILLALFYCGYKKGQQRRQEQSYNLRDREGNQGTAV